MIHILMKNYAYHFRYMITTSFPSEHIMRIRNIHLNNKSQLYIENDEKCILAKPSKCPIIYLINVNASYQ